MKAFIKVCDKLSVLVECLAGVMLIVMSASTCWQVISRYILKKSSMWTGDLSLFLFVWIVMLGSAIAVYRGKHTAITLLADKLPSGVKEAIDYLEITLVFICAVLLTTTGWQYFMQNIGSKSSGLVISLGFPTFAMPFGSFLMCVFAFGALVKKILARKEKNDK